MKKRLALLALLLTPLFLSGCVLDTILSDIVNADPRAVINASRTEGAAPLTVGFDAGYSHDDDGTIIEYRWLLGDPSSPGSEGGVSCQHTYATPGTYLVKLTVTDDDGAINAQQIAIVVTNSIPVAQASVDRDEPYPGQEVYFDSSGSHDLNGRIIDYQWEFGDGGTANGPQASHTYAEGGYYVVRLTVTDDEGATATTNFGITVMPGISNCTEPPTSGGSGCGTGANVLAVISGLPTSCGAPATVGDLITLDGTYSRSEAGEIVKYQWDFGDGTTANGPVVAHAYSKAWAYTVRLTVTDAYGNTNSCAAACSIGAGTCPL